MFPFTNNKGACGAANTLLMEQPECIREENHPAFSSGTVCLTLIDETLWQLVGITQLMWLFPSIWVNTHTKSNSPMQALLHDSLGINLVQVNKVGSFCLLYWSALSTSKQTLHSGNDGFECGEAALLCFWWVIKAPRAQTYSVPVGCTISRLKPPHWFHLELKHRPSTSLESGHASQKPDRSWDFNYSN